MTDTCTLCGDAAAWNRSHLTLHDETDSSYQQIQGPLCRDCYSELRATAEELAA